MSGGLGGASAREGERRRPSLGPHAMTDFSSRRSPLGEASPLSAATLTPVAGALGPTSVKAQASKSLTGERYGMYRSLDTTARKRSGEGLAKPGPGPPLLGLRGGASRLGPNPPLYDLLAGLQIILGIWPGTNRVLWLANVAAIWILLLGGFAAEFAVILANQLWSPCFAVALKASAIFTSLVFALVYFGRAHGFEYLVALVRRCCNVPEDERRAAYQASFRRLALIHVSFACLFVAALSTLEVYDFDFDIREYATDVISRPLISFIRFSLVLRSAFRVVFLMFFCLSCSLLRMIARGMLHHIRGDEPFGDLAMLHRVHANVLVSMRATSHSFQLVISVVLIEAVVLLLYYSWTAMSVGSRGTVYLLGNVLYQSIKLTLMLAAPAMVSCACDDVRIEFNTRLAQVAFDEGGDEPVRSQLLEPAERFARYLDRSDFHMTLFGVPIRPVIAALFAFVVIVTSLCLVWQAVILRVR